ncbi:MAG TPA: hypothetical protein VLJ17_06450 [Xanthobacteraceae bacterium]|nr:hypothetical protein [Xanthobacteraceae bacterium]
MSYKMKAAALVACMLAIGVAFTPQKASAQVCDGDPQQTALARPIPLGISGGNIHSIIRFNKRSKIKGCFGGTLGSMVQDSSLNQFILSNNHVIADQNTAKPGERIVQPGLNDVTCLKSPTNAVATFSKAIHINFAGGNNTVDAAIAAVEPGLVSPDILFIGEIADSTATPVIALPVQKMGRTTCLTTGVIAAVNANVTVNYSEIRKPKLAKFINQILVTGSSDTPTFGGPGDSGSLIVTQGTCPQAVALLFAGSTGGGVTIANPISEVLSKLSVSMVGSCTASLASDTSPANVLAGSFGVSMQALTAATSVRDRHESQLMNIKDAVGTGIGVSDGSGHPSLEVYVKKLTPEMQAAAPKDVDGLPVKLVESGEFVAY